jgi:hypothetical protein
MQILAAKKITKVVLKLKGNEIGCNKHIHSCQMATVWLPQRLTLFVAAT